MIVMIITRLGVAGSVNFFEKSNMYHLDERRILVDISGEQLSDELRVMSDEQ